MTETKKYEVTFEPKVFAPAKAKEGEAASAPPYSGTVTMRIPGWEERNEILDAIGTVKAPTLDPQESEDERAERRFQTVMAQVKVLSRLVPRFFVAADIKRLSDDVALTTWEDIGHEFELTALVSELAMWLLGKHHVPGPSKPS